MTFHGSFEDDAYSDTSTVVHDDTDDLLELDDLSSRLKQTIRHAAILLSWLCKT